MMDEKKVVCKEGDLKGKNRCQRVVDRFCTKNKGLLKSSEIIKIYYIELFF